MTTSSASSAQLGIQKLFGEEPAAPKEQVRSAAAGLLEAVLAPAPTRDSKALVALQREPADDVRSAPRFDELVRRAASDPPLRFALRACFARSTTPLRIVDDALLELALAPDADAAVVEEALALLAAPTRTATECVDVLARLCARGQRQHLARIFDTQLPSLHASIVLGALRGDARDEERSDAAALLTLHASTSSFVAQVDDVASRALLPRAGVSHLALDAARGHAAAVAEHELGRRALAASGTRALASALSNVFKAPVDGHLRKTFEARTLPAAGGAPVDRLGAQLRHVVGLPSILLNAGAQKGVRADDVQPDAELTRARPEVWLPYLLNAHLEKHDAFNDDTVQAALKHAVDDVDEWRARAIQSKDGRGSAVAQREGTAAAVAFAVVLLDLEREANSDDGSEGDRPLARLPTLLDMLASTRVSKSRNLRPQTLAALYRLAALGDTLPAGSPMWRDIDATLAAPNHGAFLQQAEDVAAEIARRHPSGVSFADALTRGLGGGTRAANVGKWAQGIANYFHVGAERAALDHLIACVTKGTLAAERRATLHAGRFAGANIEPARRCTQVALRAPTSSPRAERRCSTTSPPARGPRSQRSARVQGSMRTSSANRGSSSTPTRSSIGRARTTTSSAASRPTRRRGTTGAC
jgi:hypothetical protein